MIQVKIKRVHLLAKLPKQAREGDGGMDLYAIEDMLLQLWERAFVKTGIHLFFLWIIIYT